MIGELHELHCSNQPCTCSEVILMTLTTPRNEAAERLRKHFKEVGIPVRLIDDALATERRLTVERIRQRFLTEVGRVVGESDHAMRMQILDDEAR